MSYAPSVQATHDASNSSTTLVDPDTSFTGAWKLVRPYTGVTVRAKSDVDGELEVEWSEDAAGPMTRRELNTYTAPGQFRHFFRKQGSYMRVKYTNGDLSQNSFTLTTTWETEKDDSYSEIQYDAFHRFRVSTPFTLFQMTQINDEASSKMVAEVDNGGAATYESATSSTVMSVTAATDSYAKRQSRWYMPYQPGKSLLIMCTGVMDAKSDGNAENVESNIGLFDDDNGVFFRYTKGSGSTGTWAVVLRSKVTGSVVNTVVVQSDWNKDQLDGTGCNLVLDATKAQIFAFDIEWLGVGAVRCYVVEDNIPRLVHKFRNANRQANVYMQRATLPVRCHIEGNGAIGEMKQICATAMLEGGYDSIGLPHGIGSENGENIAVSDSWLPIISLRIKAAKLREIVQVLGYHVLTSSSGNLVYQVIHIPASQTFDPATALTGPSWVSASPTMEYDVTASAVDISGGMVRHHGFLSNNTDITVSKDGDHVTLGASIGNAYSDPVIPAYSDIITIRCQNLAGTTKQTYGAFEWVELHT